MSQQFCLKWNNHMNNMMDVFKNLLSTEAMVDVTLACDGLSLKAHKIVLSACSPFFQSLFLENPCKHPIVILKDMKYTELKAIIEFMYHGEVNVAQEKLSALMKTAETLRVKGLAEVTNDKEQSGDESSHRPSSRTGTPPSKRKKGRTRKRSISDQSDDEASQSKTSRHQDSDIEELSSDIDHNVNKPYSTASTVPSQTHRTNSFHKSRQEHSVEQHAGDSFVEEKFSVEPVKLLQQTLATDDLPRHTGRSSVASNMELQRRPQSSTDHSIVPVTSTPLSSDALVSDHQPESPIDIKPELLDLEPPMSPVAGPSHSADENSMMYMDQSNMSSMSGPSGYQDNSGALAPSDSQPQGKRTSQDESRILRKVFKNPKLSVEKPLSGDHNIVEMTFDVKPEPVFEEMEGDSVPQTASNVRDVGVTLENYTLDYFTGSQALALPHGTQVSITGSTETVSRLQKIIDVKQSELQLAHERIKYLEEIVQRPSVAPEIMQVQEFQRSAAISLMKTPEEMQMNYVLPETSHIERSSKIQNLILNETPKNCADHIIAKNSENKRKRCKLCKSQTITICYKCNVPLHAKCFKDFHISK